MKLFLKSVFAGIAFSSIVPQIANGTPTNGHLDLIEPGLIMNQSNFGATACSDAFATASAAEITGCLQLGLGPAIENNHNNIINNNTLADTNTSNISTNTSNISINTSNISTKTSNISTNTSNISTNTANISTNSSSLTSLNSLIKKDSNGDIHIGENSFVIGSDVMNGRHPIWAEDENGSKIPLNIYGSDLQINGVSVQGQIDTNKSNIKNLGSGIASSTALTAALTALPQTSKESKHSCGIGSGAYSSRYAVGFGCASKVNERVDINAGGSYVFGGAKSYGEGTLDNGVVKAGFVFKLGELKKPSQISLKDKKIINKKISILEKDNKNLKLKNNEIISQNQKLLARLEKLENIASMFQSNSNMFSVSRNE